MTPAQSRQWTHWRRGSATLIDGNQRDGRLEVLDSNLAKLGSLQSGPTERSLDHAAAPSGFARSIRARSRGLFIASHKSLRRCTFSQKSGLLPNTRARMSAVATVTVRRLLHS